MRILGNLQPGWFFALILGVCLRVAELLAVAAADSCKSQAWKVCIQLGRRVAQRYSVSRHFALRFLDGIP